MPHADAKLSAAEIVMQVEDRNPALNGLAALMEDAIKNAERAKVPPETFVAWLRAIAQHIEHAGMEMPFIADEDDEDGGSP